MIFDRCGQDVIPLIRHLRKLVQFRMEHMMKRIVATLLACIFVHGMAIGGYTQGDPPPMCMPKIRTLDIFTFYGDSEAVNRKLEQFEDELNLQRRRVYLFAIETTGGVDMYVFEKVAEGKVQLSRSRNTSFHELNNMVHNRTLRNKGEICNGDVFKTVLEEQKVAMETEIISAPTTVREAFAHAAKGYGKAYLAVQYQGRC